MNYFPFHIGDFDRATRHLTRIERSIYIDLLLLYYDSERALVKDMPALCRRVVARTEEEKAAVEAILAEFFIDTPTGWFHERCEEELEHYRKTISQASTAGKASAQARAARKAAALALGVGTTSVEQNDNESSTGVERALNGRATGVVRSGNGASTNQEPRTKNQKPITKKDKSAPPDGDAVLFPDVDPQVVVDFKALRKKKSAPVTATAMAGIMEQAVIAGLSLESALRICCTRGWSGFKAEWIQGDRRQPPSKPASRHAGFESIDYSEGIEDGRIT